ncbi:MAG: VTC domain-containing protein, partial [Bacteroidales bacterium]|nr:VTC domain-containing protein [Bacteroidales bacterium]
MRLELKYLAPVHLLDQIRSDVLIYTDYDKHVLARPDKQYTVRSIYYDTMRLEYYYEKIAGIKRRKKIRIRGYNDPDLNPNCITEVFLEIKRKNNNFISKNRSRVLYCDLENLLTNGDIDRYILPDKTRDARGDAGKFL